MNKQILQHSLNGIKESCYNGRDSWRAINDICRDNLKGEYEIIFNNIKDSSIFPETLKFIAFDWENIAVLIYREPEIKLISYDEYDKCLRDISRNEEKLLSEGFIIHNETDYKRIFLLKAIADHKIRELKKGEKIIKIGDLLNTCWGYDQTNIETFVIKKIIGKNYFIIQEVAQEQAEQTETPVYDLVKVSGTLRKVDIPIKAFIDNSGYMSICEHGYKRSLSLTNFKESHYKTNTQFGH